MQRTLDATGLQRGAVTVAATTQLRVEGIAMLFRVFGSVGVIDDVGCEVALGGQQQRRLLGTLLAAPGRRATSDAVVEALWPDAGPGGRHDTTLRSYVFRLRGALGDAAVLTTESGYRLVLDGHEVDADRFEALVRSTSETTDPAARLAVLDDALCIWAGPAYGDLAHEPWCRAEAARLAELHLVALERHAEARLALGRADEVAADLEAHAQEHPLREHLLALLVSALDAGGRRTDALRRLHAYRSWLREETGLDPGRELVALERELLGPDPAGSASDAGPVRGYVLADAIGEGSFGTVYRATQAAIGREVAVKVIRAELADDPAFIRRFEAEAQLVAGLEHPHIVPVYDYWREPGGAYLVFRLLRGGSAQDRLVTSGPLQLEDVTAIVEQIGGALAVAHAAGVVHRDVKPANILFDERGQAFLADFGIAVGVHTSSASTYPGGDLPSAGSPLYASPEQLTEGTASTRSDLYAFGVVLYELLTGAPAFDGDGATAMLPAKQARSVPSLRPRRPDVAVAFDAVLRTATAPRPEDRFADAAELILAWRAAVASGPSRTTGGEVESARTSAARTVLAVELERSNPYKGLRAFGESDAADFFGREALAERLRAEMAASRFVAVVGPSGSGKSSLVRAGVLPHVRADGAYVAVMTPGAHPFDELETALLRIAVNPPSSLRTQLGEERGLVRAIKRALPEADRAELVLVIDQFEELFTLTSDPDERRRFLDGLIEAIGDPTAPVRVLATVRADFYDRPLQHPGLGPLVRDHTFPVTPLSAPELHAAIVGPANRVGVSVEPALLTQIVADVTAQPGSLPLLQYALTELYDRRDAGVMTLTTYQQLGGIAGALTSRAEDLYHGLDANDRETVRHLFTRLVSLGEGAADTRRHARLSELTAVPAEVVERFGRHRLLAFDRDPGTREPTVEVAHEALITAWPRLRAWLDDDRDALRVLGQLSEASQAWDRGGRDADDLYRGARLAGIAELADARPGALATVELDFLAASRAADEAGALRRRRTARRLRALLVATAAGLVLAVIAGGVAIAQRSRADDNAVLAQRRAADASAQADQAKASATQATELRDAAVVRSLVTESAAAQAHDVPLSLLLAREANNRRDTASTRGALFSSLLANDPVVGFWWNKIGYSSLTLSEDGSLLAGGRDDGYVEVRRTADGSMVGEPLQVAAAQQNGPGFAATHLLFTGAGARLVVAAADGNTALWDLDARRIINRLETAAVDSLGQPFFADVARGRNGSALVTTPDGTVRSYDGGTGATLGVVATVAGQPGPLAVDAALDTLVVSYSAQTHFAYQAVLLSTSTVIADRQLALAGGSQTALAVSPDGTSFAAASTTDGASVFDVRTGAQRGRVNRSVIDPRLAFASNDRLVAVTTSAIVIDVATGDQVEGPYPISPTAQAVIADVEHGQVFVADQFAGTVVRLAFRGDRKIARDLGVIGLAGTSDSAGRRVAVALPDGGGLVVDAATGAALTPPLRTARTLPSPFRAVPLVPAISPDGTEVAIGGLTGTVDIYRIDTGQRVRSLAIPPDTPQAQLAAAFGENAQSMTGNPFWSPDGSLIGVGFWANVTVVDSHSGAVRARLGGFSQVITGGGFSADGHRLMAASFDRVTRLFDVASGAVLADHIGCDGSVAGQMTWLAGGAAIVGVPSSAAGGTACVLDADGHPTATVVHTPGWAVPQISPDRLLYVGVLLSPLRTVVVDVPTGLELGRISGLGLMTGGGRGLVSADEALGEMMFWNLDPAVWKDRACEVAGRNLTRTEWQRYLPDEDYRVTCLQFPEES